MSSERIRKQGTGVAPELVKDYDVQLLCGGKVLAQKQVRGNYQRLNVLNFEKNACPQNTLGGHPYAF